jgi:hypothetical protein
MLGSLLNLKCFRYLYIKTWCIVSWQISNRKRHIYARNWNTDHWQKIGIYVNLKMNRDTVSIWNKLRKLTKNEFSISTALKLHENSTDVMLFRNSAWKLCRQINVSRASKFILSRLNIHAQYIDTSTYLFMLFWHLNVNIFYVYFLCVYFIYVNIFYVYIHAH